MGVRGLRNNNPGNIRHSSTKWRGMSQVQTDKSFVQFTSMAYGYRALMKVICTYKQKYGICTIQDIIKRWAPDHENDTTAYIRSVCSQMEVPTFYKIDVTDKATMIALASAISRVENGVVAKRCDVEEGWNLM